MARKPGIHKSTIYAFKSQVLGKYLYARAWGYDGPNDYLVRRLETHDNPVMVAKSEKSARALLDMLPEYLVKQLAKADESVYRAQRELDAAVNRGQPHRYYERSLEQAQGQRDEILAMLNHPIDLVLVETTTETKEIVV